MKNEKVRGHGVEISTWYYSLAQIVTCVHT